MSPVITLNGENPISLFIGELYTDLGATALDDIDGELSVLSTGIVDTSATGTYTITYSVTDASGNSSSADRVVNVNEAI